LPIEPQCFLTGTSLLVVLSGLALLVFGSGEDREPPGASEREVSRG